MIEKRAPCEQLPLTRALAESVDPVTGRDAILAHAADCADCGKYLRRQAPDLLLAAFNLDLPVAPPLDARELLQKLPTRHSWRWPAAVAALLVAGVSFAVYRIAGPVARHDAPPASARISTPSTGNSAISLISTDRTAEPVIESGADNFSISEYDAAGFDGKPARWVRLRSEDGAGIEAVIPPAAAASAAPGAARS